MTTMILENIQRSQSVILMFGIMAEVSLRSCCPASGLGLVMRLQCFLPVCDVVVVMVSSLLVLPESLN